MSSTIEVVSPVSVTRRTVPEVVYANETVAPVCTPRKNTTTACTTRNVPRVVQRPAVVSETVYDKETTCVTREVCPDPCTKEPVCVKPCEKPCDPCKTYGWGSNFWTFFIIWVVVSIIVALILWAVKPNWVLNKDANGNPIPDSINVGSLILWSILIGIVVSIIVLLIWVNVC